MIKMERVRSRKVSGKLCKALPIAIEIGTTITVDRLKLRGYVSLLEIYSKIGLPSIRGTGSINFPTPDIGFNELPCTACTHGVVRPTRMNPFSRGCTGGLLVRQPPSRLHHIIRSIVCIFLGSQ